MIETAVIISASPDAKWRRPSAIPRPGSPHGRRAADTGQQPPAQEMEVTTQRGLRACLLRRRTHRRGGTD